VCVQVIVGGVCVLLMLTATHRRGHCTGSSHCARRRRGRGAGGDGKGLSHRRGQLLSALFGSVLFCSPLFAVSWVDWLRMGNEGKKPPGRRGHTEAGQGRRTERRTHHEAGGRMAHSVFRTGDLKGRKCRCSSKDTRPRFRVQIPTKLLRARSDWDEGLRADRIGATNDARLAFLPGLRSFAVCLPVCLPWHRLTTHSWWSFLLRCRQASHI